MGAVRVLGAKTAAGVLLTGEVPVLLTRAVPVLLGAAQARGATMVARVPGEMVMVAVLVPGAMVMVMVMVMAMAVAAQAHPEEACLPEYWNHFPVYPCLDIDATMVVTDVLSLRRLHCISFMLILNMLL